MTPPMIDTPDAREASLAQRLQQTIDLRLNDYLCEMKPNFDDSITGFNEAWDIVRAVFAEPWVSEDQFARGREAGLRLALAITADEDQDIAYSGQHNNWAARQGALEEAHARIKALIPASAQAAETGPEYLPGDTEKDIVLLLYAWAKVLRIGIATGEFVDQDLRRAADEIVACRAHVAALTAERDALKERLEKAEKALGPFAGAWETTRKQFDNKGATIAVHKAVACYFVDGANFTDAAAYFTALAEPQQEKGT